jgi:hypothetical protein
MSVQSGHVRCYGCDFEGVMQHRPVTLRYRLPTGETVDSHRAFAWCTDCAGIRNVEAQLDARVIRRDIDERQPKRHSFGGLLRKAVDRALGGQSDDGQALQSLLRLAQLRRTPPRCLTCGGTSVTYLDFDDEGTSSNFVHSCGSWLYRIPANSDAPRFSYRPEIVFLDVDGHRLPQ